MTNETAAGFSLITKLAKEKESEWREIQELRSRSIEAAFQEKEKLLKEERAKFQKLADDFKYNLGLLKERDSELERYDAIFSQLKTVLTAKNAEISEYNIRLDEMAGAVAREVKCREELQIHYQRLFKENKIEIENFRVKKEAEIVKERKEYESLKHQLEQKHYTIEENKELEKQMLIVTLEESFSKREHEYRSNLDQLSSSLLESQMKINLLKRESEVVRSTCQKFEDNYQDSNSTIQHLKKEIKEKEWELNDLKGMKDAEISEMKNQLKTLETTLNVTKLDFERRHAELDNYAREKEVSLVAAKKTFNEREKELKNQILELVSKNETNDIKIRQLNWTHADIMKRRDIETEKLQQEMADLKIQFDTLLAHQSQNIVQEDMKISALKNKEENLKKEIITRQEDIQRYKNKLCESTEREKTLERSKLQLDLDWQKRYEELQIFNFSQSEELIAKLTLARDEAQAEVNNIKILLCDKDQIIERLSKHENTEHEIIILKEQNKKLHDVIKDMRNEMEQVNCQLHPPHQGNSVPSDYEKALEKEVSELKAKIRKIEMKGLDNTTEIRKQEKSIKSENMTVDLSQQELRVQLKNAAKYIQQLAMERQQLIEVSNKLKSELASFKGNGSSDNKNPRTNSQAPSSLLSNKLQNLEMFQYHLTKQELRFAQKKKPKRRISNLGSGSLGTEVKNDYSPKEKFGQPVSYSPTNSPLLNSSYSESSLNNVWRLLEENKSPVLPHPSFNSVNNSH